LIIPVFVVPYQPIGIWLSAGWWEGMEKDTGAVQRSVTVMDDR
jgi:hypothetical protein